MPVSADPTNTRPAALVISPEAPYPLDGGGALRTASLLGYLALHYHLDLIAFQHPGQRVVENLPPGLVRRAATIPLRPHRNDPASRALRNAVRLARQTPPLPDRFSGYESEISAIVGTRRFELVVLEHFWTASYLPLVRNFARRVVLNLHNVESVWHKSCADSSSFPRNFAHRAFAAASIRQERRLLPLCDLALTASEEDAQRIRTIPSAPVVCVYPNAIPWRHATSFEPDFSIAFSGNMEYEPNRTGLRWFLAEIWPLLHARFPRLVFRIVGKNAGAVAEDVKTAPNVACTGAVEDPFVHLARAMVSVAPLLSGSGTRLKIIEAWAASRAVVSTSLGAEGLGAKSNETILLADTPSCFAESVASLLEDQVLRQKIANAGRAFYDSEYTWERAWSTLADVL